MNSDEQYVNSDFCSLHSEPMWGYCSRAEKKEEEGKREIGKRATGFSWIQMVTKSIFLARVLVTSFIVIVIVYKR